ncbi:hypothetical protein CHS0354_008442 [Potamilus streckersoni]|uniref:Uncharacterized protein n=1 Tax=Potamilus streckersoni TaxID=2493646 RepID=A0AAE0RQA4_9BIVA|nr:hypothetical protein CHS0354_008442 [Potamilus streckersoni]
MEPAPITVLSLATWNNQEFTKNKTDIFTTEITIAAQRIRHMKDPIAISIMGFFFADTNGVLTKNDHEDFGDLGKSTKSKLSTFCKKNKNLHRAHDSLLKDRMHR